MLDFPNAPINGQVFVAPNSVSYIWQSPPGRWNDLGASGGSIDSDDDASVTTSDTPPSNPSDGGLWWDSTAGSLFVWYVDPDGGQWVQATPTSISEPARLAPPNGTDDTVTLQAAFNANNGGTLIVPEQTYTVTTLTIPSNGITLVGEGPGSTIKQKAATNSHMIVTTAAGALLQLFGLTIDGNWQNNTNDSTHQYVGVRFNSLGTATQPARLVIRGCRFINGRVADVTVFNTDNAMRTYFELTDSYFLGGCEGGDLMSAEFVGITGQAGALIQGNTFDFNAVPTGYGRAGVAFSSPGVGPWTNPHNVTVVNNTFVSCGRAHSTTSIGVIDCYSGGTEIVISGNRLIKSYGRCITVKSDQSGVAVTGNVIEGLSPTATMPVAGAQIALISSVKTNMGQGMVCANNVCRNSSSDGISVGGSNIDDTAFYKNRLIANNVVINPAGRAISISQCTTTEIKGNSIYGGSTGIYVEASITQTMISDNFIEATNGHAMHIGNNPGCDLFIIGNQILNPTGRGMNITGGAGDCTILDNRVAVTGNSPLFMTGVTGLRFIKNNSATSDTGISIDDPTNTGPIQTDYFIPSTASWTLQYPDSTTTGGNARGANAIDLQLSRSAATQVASGANTWTLGRQNTASGSNAGTLGVFNTASGSTSFCLGNGNTAAGIGSMAFGASAHDKGRAGAMVYASGRFTANGDAQLGQAVLRAATTSTASTRLTSDGAAASLTNVCNLGANSALSLDISLLVRDTVSADTATFQSLGVLIVRGSGVGTTALVGVPVFTAVQKSAGFAAIALPTITADTTNGGINISVVALGTNATRWVASVKVTEVQ